MALFSGESLGVLTFVVHQRPARPSARPMGDDDISPERQNYIFCGSALIKTKAGATVNKYEK
jgi:hypothetical protein